MKVERPVVILGVTGSIAAYKACDLASRLTQIAVDVTVILTRAAQAFVQPLSFDALTGQPVLTDMFRDYVPVAQRGGIEHISLAQRARCLVIAPASANIIGKLARGIADDLLSTEALAVTCPILIAPAMNHRMYAHPTVQENIEVLKARGAEFVGPERGRLACGEEGWGRMAEVTAILECTLELLRRGASWQGRTVLITAGATREYIDPVRFISNPSTGKMGFALAKAAAARGARVILVHGPTHMLPPCGDAITAVPVTTAAEMADVVFKHASEADVIIGAAAVSDFAPKGGPHSQKIKKEGNDRLSLELEQTTDIIGELGRNRRREDQVVVGFALESESLEANARKKLESKRLDMIVANSAIEPDSGFSGDTNRIVIFTSNGDAIETGLMSKRAAADKILDAVEQLLERK